MTRRFLLSMVTVAAALAVVGCGSDSKDTKPVTNTAPSGKPGQPPAPPTPPDPNKGAPGK